MRYILGLLLISFCGLQAQNVLNAKSPEELRKSRAENLIVTEDGREVSTKTDPISYGYINDKDVIWSKVTWEIIDLNQRLNQPYYNSTDGLITERASLFDALKKAIFEGDIEEIYYDEFFSDKMDLYEVKKRLQSVDDSYCQDLKAQGIDEECSPDILNIDSELVTMLKIKGLWYIDKRMGQLKYRLLGIAIMGPDVQAIGEDFYEEQEVLEDLFWIWYPDARETLANYKIFNPRNSSTHITYDDMLNSRRFNSVIYKSENAYGNKDISDYIPKNSEEQLLESERIRATILQQESDMWNY